MAAAHGVVQSLTEWDRPVPTTLFQFVFLTIQPHTRMVGKNDSPSGRTFCGKLPQGYAYGPFHGAARGIDLF